MAARWEVSPREDRDYAWGSPYSIRRQASNFEASRLAHVQRNTANVSRRNDIDSARGFYFVRCWHDLLLKSISELLSIQNELMQLVSPMYFIVFAARFATGSCFRRSASRGIIGAYVCARK